MLKRLILPAVLLLASGGAFAQQPSTQPAGSSQAQPTKEQQEFRARMAKNALGVVQAVDQGNIGSLWDQSSDVMQRAVTRDAFIAGVQSERNKLGTVQSRNRVRMFPAVSKGDKQLPAGRYLTVNFATQFSNAQQKMLETVSYHFDKDSQVRLSGYTVRPLNLPAKAGSKSQ